MLNLLKSVFAIILFASSLTAQAQTDTIYFDKQWRKIRFKENSSYFRIMGKGSDGHYIVTDYYNSGIPQMHGIYSDAEAEEKDGIFSYYDSTSYKTSEGLYVKGKRSGEWKNYREDGSKLLWFTDEYVDGKFEKFRSFYRSGKLKREAEFDDGEFKSGKCFDESGNPITYTPFVKKAVSAVDITEFIKNATRYPKKCEKEKIEGIVKVSFWVDKNGRAYEVRIFESVHPLLDKEAIRVVNSMPNWQPGMRDDEYERNGFIVYVNFFLDEKKR